MKRKLLGGMLAIAACCAIFGAVADNRSSVVQAQCKQTQAGKQLATGDGTLVCDCTGGGTTCSCIVPADCPKGPAEEEMLMQ